VAAMAGTIRRSSMPASAPRVKAVSVQAANATPWVLNTVAVSTVMSSCLMNGWKNQVHSALNAPATAVTATARSTSLAIVHRVRP